jgi:NADPH:quinone reductase-like Zn-dependent oxidoreductase
MKAIVCPEYGTPEVLQLVHVQKPTPKDNEALIKVYSSTITAGDCRIIRFNFAKWFWLPGRFIFGFSKPRKEVPGWEFSGKIESVGKNVKQYKAGDMVFGFNKGISFGGTNAEYKCIAANRLIKFNPNTISCDEAAAIPIGGLTALHFLRKAKTSNGKKVLIIGASGSVGSYAVQIAKYFGAEVAGVCSNRNVELVRSIGADEVIDYKKEDFTTGNKRYDIIFDTVAKYSFSSCKNLLTDKGLFLTVDWPFIQALWTSLAGRKKVIIGMAPDRMEDLVYLKDLVQSRIIYPVIDISYPLEEVVEAYKYVDSGRKKGNIVLKVFEG